MDREPITRVINDPVQAARTYIRTYVRTYRYSACRAFGIRRIVES